MKAQMHLADTKGSNHSYLQQQSQQKIQSPRDETTSNFTKFICFPIRLHYYSPANCQRHQKSLFASKCSNLKLGGSFEYLRSASSDEHRYRKMHIVENQDF